MSDRYAGKPLLRLVECYVLHAIGHLTPDDQQRLRSLEPQLGRTYGRHGSWSDIIASELEFPTNMPQLIVEAWQHNGAIARANGMQLSAEQFAMLFVDANLNS